MLEKFQYGHPSQEWPFKRWHPGFGLEHWNNLKKTVSSGRN